MALMFSNWLLYFMSISKPTNNYYSKLLKKLLKMCTVKQMFKHERII